MYQLNVLLSPSEADQLSRTYAFRRQTSHGCVTALFESPQARDCAEQEIRQQRLARYRQA